MMSARGGTLLVYGVIFAPCSIIYPCPPSSTRGYFVCTEGCRLICNTCPRSTPSVDLKTCQIKVYYAIYCGQTPMISADGERMKEVSLLFSVKIQSKSFAKSMISIQFAELIKLQRRDMNSLGIETLSRFSQHQIIVENLIMMLQFQKLMNHFAASSIALNLQRKKISK